MIIQAETSNLLVLKERDWPKKAIAIFLGIVGLVIIFFFWNSNLISLSPFFILGAIFLISSTRTVTITIDKANDKIAFKFVGLLEKTNHEFELDQIKKIKLEDNYFLTNNRYANFMNYFVVFYLGENQAVNVPVNSPAQDFSFRGSTSFLWGERNSITALVKKVSDFIGVEFVDKKLPF